MKVWIARNKTLFVHKIDIFSNKPLCRDGVYVGGPGNTYLFEIDVTAFKKMFKFTPRKGTSALYNIQMNKK